MFFAVYSQQTSLPFDVLSHLGGGFRNLDHTVFKRRYRLIENEVTDYNLGGSEIWIILYSNADAG